VASPHCYAACEIFMRCISGRANRPMFRDINFLKVVSSVSYLVRSFLILRFICVLRSPLKCNLKALPSHYGFKFRKIVYRKGEIF